jgi:hypothetical protein
VLHGHEGGARGAEDVKDAGPLLAPEAGAAARLAAAGEAALASPVAPLPGALRAAFVALHRRLTGAGGAEDGPAGAVEPPPVSNGQTDTGDRHEAGTAAASAVKAEAASLLPQSADLLVGLAPVDLAAAERAVQDFLSPVAEWGGGVLAAAPWAAPSSLALAAAALAAYELLRRQGRAGTALTADPSEPASGEEP